MPLSVEMPAPVRTTTLSSGDSSIHALTRRTAAVVVSTIGPGYPNPSSSLVWTLLTRKVLSIIMTRTTRHRSADLPQPITAFPSPAGIRRSEDRCRSSPPRPSRHRSWSGPGPTRSSTGWATIPDRATSSGSGYLSWARLPAGSCAGWRRGSSASPTASSYRSTRRRCRSAWVCARDGRHRCGAPSNAAVSSGSPISTVRRPRCWCGGGCRRSPATRWPGCRIRCRPPTGPFSSNSCASRATTESGSGPSGWH